MVLVHRRTVMNADRIDRAIRRIAEEILEKSHDPHQVALIGIRAGGVNLTQRIADYIKDLEGIEVLIGMLDITLYRDDLSSENKPLIHKTEIDFDVTGKCLVLVDDVLFTGRTIRAAMDAVMDYGRPDAIRAAALIDRGHRELPIQPDFIGQAVTTETDEKVEVSLAESKNRGDKVVVTTELEPEEGPQ